MQTVSRLVQDPSMNEDLQHLHGDVQEREGIDTDQNALAFIRAKKKVNQLNHARKQEAK